MKYEKYIFRESLFYWRKKTGGRIVRSHYLRSFTRNTALKSCKHKIIQYIIHIAQYLRLSHGLRTNPQRWLSQTAQGAHILFILHITIGWVILSSGGQAVQKTCTSLPLKMGPKGYPETSVKNYHLPPYENYKQVIMKWWVDSSVPTNIPKEQTDLEELYSSGLDRGCTNPKFRAFGVFCGS